MISSIHKRTIYVHYDLRLAFEAEAPLRFTDM